MSETRLYVEGGGDSKELRARCREGFRKLLEKGGFQGRVPRIVACGSRNDAFADFQIASSDRCLDYAALLVDSEDPVIDREKPWEHLKARDRWDCPPGATDDQVFLMTTCMETWIVADVGSLRTLYRNCLQESALPPIADLEQRQRHDVQDKLVHATRNCKNAYAKNKRSFEALAGVDPVVLQNLLPAFARILRILDEKL